MRTVAIPRISNPGAVRREFEHRRAFRNTIKRRTRSEGRINHLKRSYGWGRIHLGINGARTWCGHGALAHNLDRVPQSEELMLSGATSCGWRQGAEL